MLGLRVPMEFQAGPRQPKVCHCEASSGLKASDSLSCPLIRFPARRVAQLITQLCRWGQEVVGGVCLSSSREPVSPGEQLSDVLGRGRRRATMACLVAAWSVHNPTVTNSIIMVSTMPTHLLPVS